MAKTVVIGAGIGGLVAARQRARAGHDIVLLERSPEPGGVMRTVRRDGFLLETGPNTVRPTPELLALVSELGLEPELLVTSPRLPRYVDFGGRLHALPTSPAALAHHAAAVAVRKAPAGRRAFRTKRLDAGREQSPPSSLAASVPKSAERVVTPFVSGVFAGDAGRLSAADAFPAVTRWERDSGSILFGAIREARRTRSGSPRRPRPRLVSRGPRGAAPSDGELPGKRLPPRNRRGARRARGRAIRRPGRRRRGRGRRSHSRGTRRGDGRARPALRPRGRRRARRHSASAARRAPPAWPLAALRRPLAGFGHLVVPDPSRRILGAVWSSSLFPGRAPEGQALLTVFLGGARDPEAPRLSDGRLVDLADPRPRSGGPRRGAAVPSPRDAVGALDPAVHERTRGAHRGPGSRGGALARTSVSRKLPERRLRGRRRPGRSRRLIRREGFQGAASSAVSSSEVSSGRWRKKVTSAQISSSLCVGPNAGIPVIRIPFCTSQKSSPSVRL